MLNRSHMVMLALVAACQITSVTFTPVPDANGDSPGDVTPICSSAAKFGMPLAIPVAESQLSSSADDWFPSLSADQLTIYLASNRSAVGTKGGFDIWSSHRSTVVERFPAPTLVDELNTAGNDYATWLTPDNCRIYISSESSQSQDIFMATRQP